MTHYTATNLNVEKSAFAIVYIFYLPSIWILYVINDANKCLGDEMYIITRFRILRFCHVVFLITEFKMLEF